MHKPIRINADPRLDGTSTNWLQSNEELLRFRAAMEISGDAIYLVDRAAMRFIDVNQTACERMGYTRDEFLEMGPHDLLNLPREQLEREYDAVIAAGAAGLTRESSARAKHGKKSVTELQRRALRWGNSWVIVSIARDVTRRKRAERASRRIGRMYAILGATNEAILRAREPAQLYQRVCDAAVGKAELITAATVLVPDSESGQVRAVASAGVDQPWIRELGVSVDESSPQGRGLVGTAYRTRRTCVSNDCLADERLLPWRADTRAQQILAAVAVPLVRGDKAFGVMHFCANEIGAFDEEIVQLLGRMGENVSFALDNLERESARERAEQAMRESERKYRNIYESLQDVYVETSPNETILEVGPQIAVLSGGLYKPEDLIGKSMADLYSDPQRRQALILALQASGKIVDFESSFKHRDGIPLPVSISARVLYDEQGRPKRVVGTIRDMTERKNAEESMRAAEEQFRGLVEQSIAGIYIIQDNRFAYVNRRYAEIFGYPDTGELIGRDPFMVVAAEHRIEVKEKIRRQLEADARTVSFTFTGLRKDGGTIVAGAHGARATHRGRPAVIGLLQDISERKRAEDQINEYLAKLEGAFMRTVEMAMTLSEMRDPYTAGHERRVAELAAAIGGELGFDARRREGLRVAGYLHDVGKISIPAEILSKPGKLSVPEMTLVRGHSQASFDILKNAEFPWPVAEVALQHHERMDGSGYPRGLKGDAILLEARILAVADVVEAMSMHRPYRPGLGIDKALAEVERGSGSAYDAAVADACVKLFREKKFRFSD